jgi:hypothetical protein
MNLKMRRYCNRIAAQMMTYDGHEYKKLKKSRFMSKTKEFS